MDGGRDVTAPSPFAVPATYGSVFADREFRALFVADVLSMVGDQLARVALAVLVYDRTGSALVTGAVYALSFLPWLVGGPLLSGIADRVPRRRVMIACDLGRAALVGLMAVPAVPLAGLAALLFLVILLEAPFSAARSATLPEIFPDDRYVIASALTIFSIQGSQVAGFLFGGVLVALAGPHGALAVDAGTFLVSAALVAAALRPRPAAAPVAEGETGRWRRDLEAGVRLVFGDRSLRRLALLGWLAAFTIVPEGLVVPYADALGAGTVAVGVLFAAAPLGTIAGALVYSRMVRPAARLRWMGPLAVLSCAPLVLCAFDPGLVGTWVLWAVAGAGSAYHLAANQAFVSGVPASARGQAMGIVQSGLIAFQGAAVLAAGAVAERVDPHVVVAGAGLLGVVAALMIGVHPRTVGLHRL